MARTWGPNGVKKPVTIRIPVKLLARLHFEVEEQNYASLTDYIDHVLSQHHGMPYTPEPRRDGPAQMRLPMKAS
jgi:hypothetical protein